MDKNSQVYGGWAKLDRREEVVGILLKSLQHTLRQTIDEALRKQGIELSFAHFAALFGLACEPGITGAQLARRAMVSPQTMNAALRGLEASGLIERRPHPDSRRADSWSLTEQGLEELNRAREVGAGVFARMLATLQSDEIATFENCLRRCIAALETPTAQQPNHAHASPANHDAAARLAAR